jgi:hypothetical protein
MNRSVQVGDFDLIRELPPAGVDVFVQPHQLSLTRRQRSEGFSPDFNASSQSVSENPTQSAT